MGSQTRARCCRRRACAARFRAPTARTRWSGPGLSSVSEPATVAEAAELLRGAGRRRHRYGAMRDLVIGVTLVLADGTIASSGGKVVKNVAGYDLGKLFSGSRGRLGLIARVALRLHPRPAASATVVVETDDLRGAWSELHRSQLTPSAVDVLPTDRIALLFEGAQSAVDAQV